MDEVLTFDEMKARYAPDWILVGEIETDDKLRLLSGKVLFHGPNHDEVCLKATEHPPGRYALRFLGTYAEDWTNIL